MKEAENRVTESTCLLKEMDEYPSLCEYFYNVKSFRNTMLTYIQLFRRDFTLLYCNQKWYKILFTRTILTLNLCGGWLTRARQTRFGAEIQRKRILSLSLSLSLSL